MNNIQLSVVYNGFETSDKLSTLMSLVKDSMASNKTFIVLLETNIYSIISFSSNVQKLFEK